MKKSELRVGKKCKLTGDISDADGALYKNDEVVVIDWSQVGKSDDTIIVTVKDITDRRHTAGLQYLSAIE